MLVYSHEINVRIFLFKYPDYKDSYLMEKIGEIRNQLIILITFG